jgi:hypothetical protein
MAVGGAAYLVSKAIKAAKVVGFADLGMEAIYEFDVQDMPVTVAVDSTGNRCTRPARANGRPDRQDPGGGGVIPARGPGRARARVAPFRRLNAPVALSATVGLPHRTAMALHRFIVAGVLPAGCSTPASYEGADFRIGAVPHAVPGRLPQLHGAE